MDRRHFLGSATALAMGTLGACATKPRGTFESTEVPQPGMRVSDRWVYRRTDGYTGLPQGMLTREVLSIDPQGIRIRTINENNAILDDALFDSPGVQRFGTLSEDGPITGHMRPAWRRYDFPLVSGKRWSDDFYLDRTDLGGTRNYVMTRSWVEGWEDILVSGKSYRALVLGRFFNMGQKNHWQGTLYRYDTEWYVPALHGFARLVTKEEFYYNRGQVLGYLTPGDRFLYELHSA